MICSVLIFVTSVLIFVTILIVSLDGTTKHILSYVGHSHPPMDMVLVVSVLAGLFLVIGLCEPLAARLRLPYSVILAAIGIAIGGGAVGGDEGVGDGPEGGKGRLQLGFGDRSGKVGDVDA